MKLKACFVALLLLSGSAKAEVFSFSQSAIVVGGSTLAGAVLGASTMPFYSEPSEHLGNVWAGAALGAVIGVAVATYLTIMSQDEMLYEEEESTVQAIDRSLQYRLARAALPVPVLKFPDIAIAADEQRVASPLLSLRF